MRKVPEVVLKQLSNVALDFPRWPLKHQEIFLRTSLEKQRGEIRFLSPLTFCMVSGKVHSDPSAQGYAPKTRRCFCCLAGFGRALCKPARLLLFNWEKCAGACPQLWRTTVPKEISAASFFPKRTRKSRCCGLSFMDDANQLREGCLVGSSFPASLEHTAVVDDAVTKHASSS